MIFVWRAPYDDDSSSAPIVVVSAVLQDDRVDVVLEQEEEAGGGGVLVAAHRTRGHGATRARRAWGHGVARQSLSCPPEAMGRRSSLVDEVKPVRALIPPRPREMETERGEHT